LKNETNCNISEEPVETPYQSPDFRRENNFEGLLAGAREFD
jgi:hypothetical protein